MWRHTADRGHIRDPDPQASSHIRVGESCAPAIVLHQQIQTFEQMRKKRPRQHEAGVLYIDWLSICWLLLFITLQTEAHLSGAAPPQQRAPTFDAPLRLIFTLRI